MVCWTWTWEYDLHDQHVNESMVQQRSRLEFNALGHILLEVLSVEKVETE